MIQIKWETGVYAAVGGHIIPSPYGAIHTGDLVTGKFKGTHIQLRIKKQLETNDFLATVKGFYFQGEAHELKDGDEVRIDFDHILGRICR